MHNGLFNFEPTMPSQAKENILKKIRAALANPVQLPFAESEGSQSVYKAATEDDAVQFAEEFTKLQGKFSFCNNEEELLLQLDALIKMQGWEAFDVSDETEKDLEYTLKMNFIGSQSEYEELCALTNER